MQVRAKVLLILLVGGTGWGGEGAALELAMAQEVAVRQDPELLSLQAQLEAALARRAGASTWLAHNPELTAAAGPRSRGGESSVDYEFALVQLVEISGQRGGRIEVAEAAVRQLEAQLASRRLALASQVRQAFGAVLQAQERAQLVSEAQALAQQALAAAQERHRAGSASLIEVNTARIEVGRAAREVLDASQRRALAMARLRGLLALPPAQPLRLEGSLKELSALSAGPPRLQERPELAAARAELEAAQAELRLSGREAFPTPKLGAGIGHEEDATYVRATLGIELPLFQRNQAARGVALARVRQAQDALVALERSLAQELSLAQERRQAALAALEALGAEVLGAAKANLELADEGYRAGQLDFLQLLLIRRETLEARRSYLEALEELNAAQAELDRFS